MKKLKYISGDEPKPRGRGRGVEYSMKSDTGDHLAELHRCSDVGVRVDGDKAWVCIWGNGPKSAAIEAGREVLSVVRAESVRTGSCSGAYEWRWILTPKRQEARPWTMMDSLRWWLGMERKP